MKINLRTLVHWFDDFESFLGSRFARLDLSFLRMHFRRVNEKWKKVLQKSKKKNPLRKASTLSIIKSSLTRMNWLRRIISCDFFIEDPLNLRMRTKGFLSPDLFLAWKGIQTRPDELTSRVRASSGSSFFSSSISGPPYPSLCLHCRSGSLFSCGSLSRHGPNELERAS